MPSSAECERHGLLYLDPLARYDGAGGEDSSLVRGWIEAGRPVIARRPGIARGGEGVHCGLPLPPSMGKRRIGLVVPCSAIKRHAPLPRLKDCVRLLPAEKRQRVGEFQDACAAAGFSPEVFGSLAWERLTGLPYLRPESDVDLRFRLKNGAALTCLLGLLRSHGSLCQNFFDIEIELWSGWAFSWREFVGGSPEVLIKTLETVFMVRKSLVSELGAVSEPGPEQIAFDVESALLEELATYPKPGLVSHVDSGSHKDMDAKCFADSIVSLRGYFQDVAEAGTRGAGMDELRGLGMAAEARMLDATHGANTHRGAVFTLGLLAAAAGRKLKSGANDSLGGIVKNLWGRDIMEFDRNASSNGLEALRRHGCGGARIEAASGFPSVYGVGLPAFKSVVDSHGRNAARIHCLFALLEKVEDTTLVHRGGLEGLRWAREAAGDFNSNGGVNAPDWGARAASIHREFIKRNLSPGGVADLLTATIFAHRMEDLCRA